MAQKKKPKKTSWLKIALLYVFVPIIIWIFTFFAWLYWDDITKLFSKDSAQERSAPRASRKLEKADKSTVPSGPPREKILDEDRKKLEDILKQRQ